jgi:hypothetical protein
MPLHRSICPGRNPSRSALNRGKTDFAETLGIPSENGDGLNQLHEIYYKNDGADLGMSEKILHRALLSGRIYKICTLLSTDIVENIILSARAVSRKALLGAPCGACVACLWDVAR